MDDDHEVLDWGNEDDEIINSSGYDRTHNASFDVDPKRSGEVEDVEDAVSLGGDDDDMQDYMPPAYRGDANGDAPGVYKGLSSSRGDGGRRDQDSAPPDSPRKAALSHSKSSPSQNSSQPNRNLPQPLKHALPPKPVVSSTFLPLPSTTAASPMSMARRDKERRSNGVAKSAEDALPPDWELRTARNGTRESYFYNVRTHESTWSRPEVGSPDARAGSRSEQRDSITQGYRDDASQPSPALNDSAAEPTGSMTYGDRHYRPGDASVSSANRATNGERDDRSTPKPSHGSYNRQEKDAYDRSYTVQDDTHRRAGNPSHVRERDRVPSPPPLDNRTRRVSQKGDSRIAPPGYDGVDVYAQDSGYRDSIRRSVGGPERTQRPQSPPYQALPASIQEPPPYDRSTGRSSTLRRRSPPSPRHLDRSPTHTRHMDRGYPSPQSEPPLLPPTSRPERASRIGDEYVAPDSVPRRRAREPLSMSFDADPDAKRQRTDSRSGDSAPARRALAEDTYQSRDPSTSPRSVARQLESHQARKRAPLPPQSDRYREMATTAPPAPLPTTVVAPPSVPTRPAQRVPPSAPSGPRHTHRDVTHEYAAERRQSDVGHASRSTRQDPGRGFADERVGRERDTMDIDLPYPSRTASYQDSSRPHEPPRTKYELPARPTNEPMQSRSVNEPIQSQRPPYDEQPYAPSEYGRQRVEGSPRRSPDYERIPRGPSTGRDPVPRAPRAMGSRIGSTSLPQYPAQPTPPAFEPAARRVRDRSPPSRPRDARESIGRADFGSAPTAPASHQGGDVRRSRYDESLHRPFPEKADESTHADPRAPPASHASRSRFADAQPAPPLPLKASGPNSVPIGARKGPSPGAVSQHSPVERLNRREPFNGGGDAVSGRRGRDYVDDEPSRSAPVPSQRVPSRASPDNARAPPRRERPAQPPHSDSFAPQAPTAPRRESFTTSERVSRFGPPIQRPSEDSVQDNRRWPARPLTPPPPRHTTPPPPPSRAYALDDTERYTDRRLSSVRAERSTGLVEDVSRLRVAHDDDRLDRRAPPRRNDSPGRRSDYSYDRPSVEDARAERNRHSPPVQRDREPPRRKETSPYARTQPLPEPRRPASWDRPPTPDSARLPPRPADHVPNHVESRNVSPPPATVHEPAPTARTSKPVRIRRPPAEAYSREMPPPPAKEGHAILERIEKRPEPVHALPERVPLRRAPSLLDRLSSDKPSGQGPSLRERVDDWDMDTGGGARYSRDDDESNGDGGRGRSKKRGRPKRGSIQVVILDRLAVDVGHQRDRHQGERADE